MRLCGSRWISTNKKQVQTGLLVLKVAVLSDGAVKNVQSFRFLLVA